MAKRKCAPVGNVPMTARTLRALAYEYLRYECGCYMVTFERSPYGGKPDVLGLDRYRRLFELEIKVDKADFDRDAKKPHRMNLLKQLSKYKPTVHNYLAYLIPLELVEHVRDNAPGYAGIITVNATKLSPYTGFPTLEVIRPPIRLHDNRLSMRHCAVMARDMSGTMASLLRDDVKEHVRREVLEEQVVALGGVLPKHTRKKKTAAPGADIVATGTTRKKPVASIATIKKAVKKSASVKKSLAKEPAPKRKVSKVKKAKKNKTTQDELLDVLNAPSASTPTVSGSGWGSIKIQANSAPLKKDLFKSKKTRRQDGVRERKQKAAERKRSYGTKHK